MSELRLLALVLEAQSKWDQAVTVLNQMLRQEPNNLSTLRLIGNAYAVGEGQYEMAHVFSNE